MVNKLHNTFTFLDWHFDALTGKLQLNYEIETIGKVTEVLIFPPLVFNSNKKQDIDSACELIHLLCGVSYYKSGLAKELIFSDYKPSTLRLDFVKKTWFHGLAELAYENNVDLKFDSKETLTTENIKSDKSDTPIKNSLVALGGGKDSLVTIEELKAHNKNIILFMVGNSKLIKEVAKFIDLPMIQVKRKIDDKLIAYNKSGAINGHVPITSINSAIALLTALLFDCQEVVFSNEKSADSENTINKQGHKVNHQYSKSLEFEQDFSTIIAQEINTNIRYYSQQRQFSELEILEKFSQYPQYFPVFSSCNRNFHIDGSHNKQNLWCCDCPKCRFVFLGLAPYLSKAQLLTIFGHNLLDDENQKKGFAELLGVEGIKPFECVGEVEESAKALELIKDFDDWKDDCLVNYFANKNYLKLNEIKNKKIAIWGFGVEGQSTAKYLNKNSINFVVLCDATEKDERYSCDVSTVDSVLLSSFDIIIKSPGISPYSKLVKSTQALFTSATALWFANENQSDVIAISGTKGKSTIASLLNHVLLTVGKNVKLVGNIGTPLIESSKEYDYVILEASSFQIFDGNIQADIALINNLYPEHVDWHQGADNYFNDKLKLFERANVKIINAKNTELLKRTSHLDCVHFNQPAGFHVHKKALNYQDNKVLDLSDLQLIGEHNLENTGAVLTVCAELKLNLNEVISAIKSFKPLKHRLQNLGKIGKHFAINDSIATTPIATIAALQTQNRAKTVLFVGGYDRGNDWSEFAQQLNDSPPCCLFLTGQSGLIIYHYLESITSKVSYKYFEKLKEAIIFAVENTPESYTLLMSPGAPSFDEFENYKQRGHYFEKKLRSH